MLLMTALIVSVLFVRFFRHSLEKHPYPFYIGAGILSLFMFLGDFSNAPIWLDHMVISLFSRGALGTALFTIVMYTGTLKKGTRRREELMKVRGELSILAAIFVLVHNLTYGRIYLQMIFTGTKKLAMNEIAAAILSLVMMGIMLVLTVTSFPQVRKRMDGVYGICPSAHQKSTEKSWEISLDTIGICMYGAWNDWHCSSHSAHGTFLYGDRILFCKKLRKASRLVR